MAKKRYYQIWDFMTEDLDLKKNELLVYALIYSFSRKKNTRFNGSVAYIAARTNASVRDVKYSIASLKKKGLIKVFKKNATRCEYYAVKPDKVDEEVSAKIAPFNDNEVSAKIAPFSKKQDGAKIAPPLVQNLHSTGAKIAHNNKKDNKNIYKDRLGLTKKIPDIPTREEVHEYVAAHDLKINPDAYYDENESRHWITMAGTPVRCWKNHLRFWASPDIPTREEVRKYVAKHKLKIDPDKYYDENESRHWITIAGTPVRRWENHLKFWASTERPEKDYQNAMMHTQYDYDEIEQNLLRN